MKKSTEARRQGKYMFKLAGGSDYPDPFPAYQKYMCEPDPRKRRLNESGYCNRKYDALLKEAEAEWTRRNGGRCLNRPSRCSRKTFQSFRSALPRAFLLSVTTSKASSPTRAAIFNPGALV